MLDYNGLNIRWDGHASICVTDDGFTVAVDPFGAVSPDFTANIVLITHRDEGHFDPDKIEQVCTDNTVVVIPESIESEDIPCLDVETIAEGEMIDVYGVGIEAVPMYNNHHERGEGNGYRFVMKDTSLYVAGDTGMLEDVSMLENHVDLAFLPVEGVYTMDQEEAIRFAVRFKPSAVVPYHYGKPFFSDVDLKGFKAELEDRSIDCFVLENKD